MLLSKNNSNSILTMDFLIPPGNYSREDLEPFIVTCTETTVFPGTGMKATVLKKGESMRYRPIPVRYK